MSYRINGLLILVALILSGCGTSELQRSTATEYASIESLAEVEDLITLGAQWKVIDLRKPEEFEQGHIHSALNVWRTDITDTTYPYGGMMPTQIQMELLLGNLGIMPKDTLVVYDHKAECDAARMWWILKFYGHQHVKLLNGGLKAWITANGLLSNSRAMPEPSNYRFLTKSDSSIHASADFVRSILSYDEVILLDTRSDEEFNGKLIEGAAKGGHIENARNLDWAMTVDFNGNQKFLDADQLKANFQDVGIDGTQPIITYCHSGVRSAHTFFVLTELLGYRHIKNYDGSWIEWSRQHPK